MLAPFNGSSTSRLYRFGFLLLAGLWWINLGSMPSTVSALSCNENSICEPQAGENSNLCPNDCDCECGDNICGAGETCAGCPEDCEQSCICGDSVCDWPAEAGGYPYESCEEAEWYFPETTCTYCGRDCGECDNDLCAQLEGKVCASSSGQCVPCDEWDDQCADEYNCVDGTCVPVPVS